MSVVELHLNEELLAKIASGSLVGLVLNESGGRVLADKVRLMFHNTTMTYKKKHGGPKIYLMPEHVPACLAMGIVELISMKIEVEVYIVEDEDE